MNKKRLVVLLLVMGLSFVAGGLSAFLYYTQKLATYEKLTSALAR